MRENSVGRVPVRGCFVAGRLCRRGVALEEERSRRMVCQKLSVIAVVVGVVEVEIEKTVLASMMVVVPGERWSCCGNFGLPWLRIQVSRRYA